jgi:hypothetical protein
MADYGGPPNTPYVVPWLGDSVVGRFRGEAIPWLGRFRGKAIPWWAIPWLRDAVAMPLSVF